MVLSEGVNPYLSDLDTQAMAGTVVDEAIRRQLCAGARLDRISALDNFCWPDPIRSERTPDGEYKLAQLVRACRALYEVCSTYGVPLISGKDSMKNESVMGGVKICVPPTLLVSALGQIDDVREAVTLEFQRPGDVIFLLGETGGHSGGSEYFRYLGDREHLVPELGQPAPYLGTCPPTVAPHAFLPLYRALERVNREGIVRSAATPTKGGLAVSLAKCCLAGDVGAGLNLAGCAGMDALPEDLMLFSESNGRFVVSVAADRADAFEERFEDLPCSRVGVVEAEPRLVIRRGARLLVDVAVAELRRRFREGLADA
jgi:phosphoribosylformylglycinamidine synthase